MPRAAKASKLQTVDLFSSEPSSSANLPDIFRKIYYHLYSNSNASRADVIIADLSMLLLCQLAAEKNGHRREIADYVNGIGSANASLLPIVASAFPSLDDNRKFALDDRSLRAALSELREAGLSQAPAHVLGEAFQALIGPRLRGERGQFFTPKSLVRAMVSVVDPKPGESIVDPACGTGGFLAEAHVHQCRLAKGKQPTGVLIGVDKDSGLAWLASALLTLISGERSQVYDFNSLDDQAWKSEVTRKTPAQFDVILTNPPFGAKIGITDKSILSNFDFGHVWTKDKTAERWQKTPALVASEDPQILFIELCVRRLKPGGRMGIVLPEGVFGNKNTSYVWDWLESQGEIFALLDCPRTTFQPGTDTKTNVLFFRKRGPRASQLVGARVAVALHCGHDRRGRSFLSNGNAHVDDFPAIGAAFSDKNSALWQHTNLLGKRYLVPRYFAQASVEPTEDQDLIASAKTITLRELVQKKIISIRKGHEVGSDAYGTGDIPFIRTSDLSNFEISSDPTKSVSESVYAEYGPQQNLRVGDILMVVDGRYKIGTTAILDAHNQKSIVQSHLRIISSLKPDKLDPYELLFALNLPSVKLRMRSLVFIQSTLGTMGNRLLELRVPLLHGAGPWSARVVRFRESLQRRGQLLSDLRGMTAGDYEL